MENTETPTTQTVSVDLSAEQYAFLTKWQKTHEQELGIEVPVGAMVRKAVDIAMKSAQRKEEDKPRDARPPRAGGFGDKPRGDRPPRSGGFGDKPGFKSGPRKSFGDRPAGRGPKFDMTSPRSKSRSF